MTVYSDIVFVFLLLFNLDNVLSNNCKGDWIQCCGVCCCRTNSDSKEIDCSGENLSKFPEDIPFDIVELFLNNNQFVTIPSDAFTNFTNLKVLHLSDNRINELDINTFKALAQLEELFLSRNNLHTFPVDALNVGLSALTHLSLDGNDMMDIPAKAFVNLTNLRNLGLSNNRLNNVPPQQALSKCPKLEKLDLSYNRITSIRDNAFLKLTKLETLFIDFNKIGTIGLQAFEGLNNLAQLDLKSNGLTYMPAAMQSLAKLKMLELSHNYIKYIPDGAFMHNSNLVKIVLDGNDINMVGNGAFINLPKLTILMMSRAPNMHTFPNLNGTVNLQKIVIDSCGFSEIPEDLCNQMKSLTHLELHYNNIEVIPDLSGCTSLKNINLAKNAITSLDNSPFKGLKNLLDLTLNKNKITHVRSDSFLGLDNLLYLELSENLITEIERDAFTTTPNLVDLNLAYNQFPTLPEEGFEKLMILKVAYNDYLIDFPAKESFPSLLKLIAASAYHCCDYLDKEVDTMELEEEYTWLGLNENVSDWSDFGSFMYISISSWMSDYADNSERYSVHTIDYEASDPKMTQEESIVVETINRIQNTLHDAEKDEDTINVNFNSETQMYNMPNEYSNIEYIHEPVVDCKPMPGPFWPCEQLLDSFFLRIGVWFVFLTAIIGNSIVIFVICVSRTKMDVPRFLIMNLACADFAMGMYLGFLAIVDVTTMHEFRKYGLRWQNSNACNSAGFMAVFSSELSIYTLTVITLERFYAIRHAVNLNKRLKLRTAVVIMLFGWIFAMASATLPLVGVNHYHRYSVCLPFETRNMAALAYIAFLMILNGLAFLAILLCYMSIYLAIRGSHAWNCNDSRVAQRMSILIFTDFICWAPIAFVGLTSAFGSDMISINCAKFLTVFILPINSFFNPFLYTIFTQHFKKDLKKILLRIRIQTPKIPYPSRSASHSYGRRMSPASHDLSNKWRASDSGFGKSQNVEPPEIIVSALIDQRQNSPRSSPQSQPNNIPRGRLESESTVATRVTIESRLSTTMQESSCFETSEDDMRHNHRRGSELPLMQKNHHEQHVTEEDLTKMSPLTRLRHFSMSLLSPRSTDKIHDTKSKLSIGSLDLITEDDRQYSPSVFSRKPIRNKRLCAIQVPFERSRGSSEGNCSQPSDWDTSDIRTRANSLPEKGRADTSAYKLRRSPVKPSPSSRSKATKTSSRGEACRHHSEIQHLLAPGEISPPTSPIRRTHTIHPSTGASSIYNDQPVFSTESVWQRRPNENSVLQSHMTHFPSPSLPMSPRETMRRLDAAKETTL